jgi:hypothetical protein
MDNETKHLVGRDKRKKSCVTVNFEYNGSIILPLLRRVLKSCVIVLWYKILCVLAKLNCRLFRLVA